MRKYFEGLTLSDGAFLIFSFAFGIFLRFISIKSQSPWTDELASWYYLRHLDEVFTFESHSPLYYFLIRLFVGGDASIFGIRVFSVLLSCFSIVSIFFLAQKTLDKSKVVLLVVLLSLCPADIVYARMARHYSLLLEGSLIFYFLVQNQSRTWVLSILGFFLGFIHIFALIPIFCILGFDYFQTRNLKRNLIIAASSCGICVYYVARVFIFGSQKVGSNVSWNSSQFTGYLIDLVTQFFGDAYPRNQFYFVSFGVAVTVIACALIYILWRKKRSGLLLASIWISSILFVEFLNLFWINLRISRYAIYLCGFLILALVDAIPHVKRYHLISAFLLSLMVLFRQDLVTVYPWDDEVVSEYKEYAKQYPDTFQFICCNKFQKAYYNLPATDLCRNYVQFVDVKKPVLFFDLNNNDSFVAMNLMNSMKAQDYKDFRHSRIILFKPR